MHLSCILLTAATAILPTHASPFSSSSSLNFLLPRDLSGTSCVPFVYGATNTQFDKVCVSVTGDTLTITYPSLPSGGAYTDIHAIVQTTPVTEAIQGQWPYGLGTGTSKSGCTKNGGTATCSIPIQLAWRACNLKLYIGVHASFSLDGVNSQTGWADGTCIKARPNCPKYFVFTTECQCPVVTTYEPITTSVCICRFA
jgi:hypothetical protein